MALRVGGFGFGHVESTGLDVTAFHAEHESVEAHAADEMTGEAGNRGRNRAVPRDYILDRDVLNGSGGGRRESPTAVAEADENRRFRGQ